MQSGKDTLKRKSNIFLAYGLFESELLAQIFKNEELEEFEVLDIAWHETRLIRANVKGKNIIDHK